VVKAFWAACEGGDLAGLVRLLDPDVVTLVDGGGTVSAALRPIRGAEKVSRYVLGSLSKAAELRASLETVSGRVGVVLRLGEAVAAVVSVEVKGDLITDLWLVMTPDKLTTFRSE
jgi:RNA polymerase sigma-70 factor (ECF subfamily)